MAMTPAQRKRPVRQVPWQYPIAAEKTYARLLKGWLSRLITFTEDFIKSNAGKMIRGDSAEQEIRADELPGGTFDILVNSLNGWMATYVPETPNRDYSSAPTVWAGLGKMADDTNDANWRQWKNQTKTSIGVEFPKDEPWWDSVKTRWQEENYKYFRKLGVEYTTKVSELAEEAVVNGESVKTLRENIRRLGANISGPRANLIARDQIGKLNGMITQGRMTDVGLEMYIWETAGDERVRGQPGGKYADAVPSHAAMDYKLCRWDNSTVYSEDGGKTWIDRPPNAVRVHPGMDIQCRCVGTPYWEEMIGEADTDAFGEPQIEVTEPVAPIAAKLKKGRPKSNENKPKDSALKDAEDRLSGLLKGKYKESDKDVLAAQKAMGSRLEYMANELEKEMAAMKAKGRFLSRSDTDEWGSLQINRPDFWKDWTDREKGLTALRLYTDYGYKEINAYLREGKDAPLAREAANALKKFMKTQTIKEDVVVSRGQGSMRGWLGNKKGDVIEAKGFVSASASPADTRYYEREVRILIKVPKGSHALYVNRRDDLTYHTIEDELVLNDGAKFRIDKITKGKDKDGRAFIVKEVTLIDDGTK
jgi:hypothetical protein